MKNRKYITLAAAGCACGMIFGAQSAAAQQIHFTGELCPLPVSAQPSADAEVVTNEVSDANVLGMVDGFAAVALEDSENPRIVYVAEASLEELVPGMELAMLPDAEDVQTLVNGSSGDEVAALQEALISLEYLEGEADGKYGPNTGGAVNKVKSAYGLAEDGQADAVAQWLIEELADIRDGSAEPVESPYPPVYEVETKFAPIYERTGADLSGFLTPDWDFEYDVFDGVGSISDGTQVGTLSIAEPAINRLDLSADMMLSVTRDEAGEVMVVPAIHVSTLGAYCPYLQTIQIRAGDEVAEIALTRSERGVSGVSVTEDDIFALTGDAAMLLADEESELTLRFNGTAQSYDMTVPAGQLMTFADAVSSMALASAE